MCAAVALFPFLNAGVKYLSDGYSTGMIVWSRYAGHMLIMVVIYMPSRGGALFKTGQLPTQILRSLLLFSSTAFYFSALPFLPLATAASISFTAPFIVTGLSIFVLGERVGPRRWAAVVIGFIGMLIIIRPGGEGFHWAGLLVLASATSYAIYQVMTRRMAGRDDSTTTAAYTALVGAVVSTLALPMTWATPASWLDAGVLLSLGLVGGLGHQLVIKSFQYGEASVITPFTYGQLLGATVLGYLIFGDFPDLWTWLGVAIIVGCGIYVAYRESRLSK